MRDQFSLFGVLIPSNYYFVCMDLLTKIYMLQKNGQYPDRIFIYRDGVGDGQLEAVKNYEVRQFLNTCSRLDPAYKPKLSVIIVQKRVNTRIFEKVNLNKY